METIKLNMIWSLEIDENGDYRLIMPMLSTTQAQKIDEARAAIQQKIKRILKSLDLW